MADCPHCKEGLGSGYLTQEDHETRLNAKTAAMTLLTTELTTAKTKAQGYDAIVAERDTLKGEITKRDERSARSDAMKEAGLDPSLLSHVEILYNSATAGQDAPKSLAEWLGEEGKAHPLLSDKFGTPGEPPPPKPGEPPKPNLNGNPNTTVDTAPPGAPGQKLTPTDVQNYINSPEYKGLSSDDKRTKIIELKAQVAAQDQPAA